MTLTARSTWLDAPVDLVTVAGDDGWLWQRDGCGLAGRGVALTVPAAAAVPTLQSIRVRGDAPGPVAVGSLPFSRSAGPSELVVPAVLVGRTAEGRSWMTTIGPAAPSEFELSPMQDPDGFELRSPVPHQEWMDLVAKAVVAIEAGELRKVVVAREVTVLANRRIDVPTVLRRLRSLYPACTVVSTPVGDGQFVAASPELLVSRSGSSVASHPLAGTIPRSGDPAVDSAAAAALLGSPKDRAEHDWVVRDVVDTLRPWCSALSVPASPSIVPLRNVSHLGTLITGTLADGAPSALELAQGLHPTAAVGGTPREEALAWLAANERLDRGPYAGPVGWVDANGDGEWVVGIRSAVIAGPRARLFAGVGVVEGSDPAAELAESQFKLQALLAAVVRP